MRNLLFLLCIGTVAWAEPRWQHYNLNVSLVQPPGWRITQGPVMVELTPEKGLRGERRPTLKVTWEQAAPTFPEFEQRVREAAGYQVLARQELKVGGQSALSLRLRVMEKGTAFPTQLILVRAGSHGYLITAETMVVDAATVEPVFQKIIASLQLGTTLRHP